MAEFAYFRESDYEAVRWFLVELNQKSPYHLDWNWARFEWMYAHPMFDKSTENAIGLWWSDNRVVGAAIYDMYFGEAFCGCLPEQNDLYPQIVTYAYEKLRDEDGMCIYLCEHDAAAIETVKALGFVREEQRETILSCNLCHFPVAFPEGIHAVDFDPVENACEFQWLLWQGFDHGTDETEFQREETIACQYRPNLNTALSLAARRDDGRAVGYCCLWFDTATDYAYVEPLCIVPEYRNQGIARNLLHEAMNRAAALGAKKAIVLSDMDFYKKAGFETDTVLWPFRKK